MKNLLHKLRAFIVIRYWKKRTMPYVVPIATVSPTDTNGHFLVLADGIAGAPTDLLHSGDWILVGDREAAESWRQSRTLGYDYPSHGDGACSRVVSVDSPHHIRIDAPIFLSKKMRVWKLLDNFKPPFFSHPYLR